MSSQTDNIGIANLFVSFKNNLKDIPFQKYEKNFTFIVNGKRYETNRVVADILSPIIRNYHYQDESIDEFEIKTNYKNQSNEPDYFQDFLNLVNYDKVEVDFLHSKYYIQYMQQLGCSLDCIKSDSIFTDELTIDNSVKRLKTIQLFFPDHSDDEEKSLYFEIIQFISQNFDEISKDELRTLDIGTIEDIFRSDQFCIQSEDSLLEFVLELYYQDHSNAPLFEYVLFNYTSDEKRADFVETFSIDDIDSSLFRSIFLSFCQKDENIRKGSLSKEVRCLMLGIDDAGKTAILYKMKLGENVKTIRTIGFNVETIVHDGFSCNVCEVGGQDRIRVLWKHYYDNNDALIFVVDSSNSQRINEARDELRKLLEVEELKESLLLVWANKCDLPSAMSADEITRRLDLNSITDRKWSLQMSSALTGMGINEGLDFICEQIKSKRKKSFLRK